MNILLSHLTKRYGDRVVFDDLTAELRLSPLTALMGPSGCGKTTLLRLLCGLERPSGGTISGFPDTYSLLFQEDRLLPWKTALENVELVAEASRAAEWLRRLGLGEELGAYPERMSGGMRRRVALARALAYEGAILLLDEPLKGLDEALRERTLALIAEESRRRPVLLVTHDVREADALGAEILTLDGAPAVLSRGRPGGTPAP